jgi:hypothetical protein
VDVVRLASKTDGCVDAEGHTRTAGARALDRSLPGQPAQRARCDQLTAGRSRQGDCLQGEGNAGERGGEAGGGRASCNRDTGSPRPAGRGYERRARVLAAPDDL